MNDMMGIPLFGSTTPPPSNEYIVNQWRKQLRVYYTEKYPEDQVMTDFLGSQISRTSHETVLFMRLKNFDTPNEFEINWIKSTYPDFSEIHRELLN